MKQKVLCLLIVLPLMLVMRVLAAQDFDKRLFGKWQGTGVFHVLKLDLSSKGNYTIERDNKTVKSGRYKASAGKILFYPETGTESDESGFYELKGMEQLTVETDLSGKVQWLRLTGIAPGTNGGRSSEKQKQTGIFAVESPEDTEKFRNGGSSETAGGSDAATAAGTGNDSIDRVKSFYDTVKKHVETAISKTKEAGQSLAGSEKLKVSSDKVGETWQNDPVSNAIKKGQDAIGESHAKVCDVTQTVTEPVSGTVETAQKKMEGVETAGSEVVRGVIEDTLNHSAEAQQKIYDEAKAYNSELSEELAKKAASASEKAVPKESGSGFFKTFGKLFKKSESGQVEKNHQGKNSSANTQSNSNQLP